MGRMNLLGRGCDGVGKLRSHFGITADIFQQTYERGFETYRIPLKYNQGEGLRFSQGK